MSATAVLVPASRRFGYLLDEPVVVTFEDGEQEAGFLTGAGEDTIEVEHCDITGGGHFWTAVYSLIGDEDTPRVESVQPDAPQKEMLF